MKFSIIVPIYNAQKHLDQCISSLINQDMSDYEIILINDGSTDESKIICEKYQEKSSKIILINQRNQGVSAARNAGLNCAKGEYIIFTDADDFLTERILKKTYNYLQQQELEVLTFNYLCYSPEGNMLKTHCPANMDCGEIISGVDYIKKHGMNIFKTAWMYIYSKDFIDKFQLKFAVGLYHEDCEWTSQWFPYVKKLGYLNKVFYNQTLSERSIMRSKSIKKSRDLIEISSLIHQNASKSKVNKVKKELHKYGAFESWSAIHSCISQGFALDDLINSVEIKSKIIENMYDNFRYRAIWILVKYNFFGVIECLVKMVDTLRK